jgi:lysophospholipase L1-like esterase
MPLIGACYRSATNRYEHVHDEPRSGNRDGDAATTEGTDNESKGSCMRRLARLVVLMSLMVSASVLYPIFMPAPAPAHLASAKDATVDIMPLGDSITGSTGCWRELLWNELIDTGYTGIDFIGRHEGPACDAEYDDDNNGVSGTRVVNLAKSKKLLDWFKEDKPDIVLLHLGSNDIRHGKTTGEIIDALTVAVEQMRQVNPDVVILAARIIPMTDEPMHKKCDSCPAKVDKLNGRIPGWAADNDTARSPLIVVDHTVGFDPDKDTYDGLHSDGSGAEKIAGAWYRALTDVL